jgi:hypothetical protein
MLQNFIFTNISTHSHIPCHCEALFKWALYNCLLGICLLSIRTWLLCTNNTNYQYNIPSHKMHQSITHKNSHWTTYCHRYLYTQYRKLEQLRMYNRNSGWCCYYSNIDWNWLTCGIGNVNILRLFILWCNWGWLAAEVWYFGFW